MNPGESRTVTIHAHREWNETGIRLEAGNTYCFSVPENDKWVDFFIPCNADGYPGNEYMNQFADKKRVVNEPWFKLIGTIGKNNDFAIGTHRDNFVPATSGELVCYANDHRNKIFIINNWGKIELTVTRTN